jgi:hypothetical protein
MNGDETQCPGGGRTLEMNMSEIKEVENSPKVKEVMDLMSHEAAKGPYWQFFAEKCRAVADLLGIKAQFTLEEVKGLSELSQLELFELYKLCEKESERHKKIADMVSAIHRDGLHKFKEEIEKFSRIELEQFIDGWRSWDEHWGQVLHSALSWWTDVNGPSDEVAKIFGQFGYGGVYERTSLDDAKKLGRFAA